MKCYRQWVHRCDLRLLIPLHLLNDFVDDAARLA
jgi:hypothetical protein